MKNIALFKSSLFLCLFTSLCLFSYSFASESVYNLVGSDVTVTMSDSSVIDLGQLQAGGGVHLIAEKPGDFVELKIGATGSGTTGTNTGFNNKSDSWTLINTYTSLSIASVAITLINSTFTNYVFSSGPVGATFSGIGSNIGTLTFAPDLGNSSEIWYNDTVTGLPVITPEPGTYAILASFLGTILFFHSRKRKIA